MDPNIQTQTPQSQPVNPVLQQAPVQPQPQVQPTPQPASGGGKKWLKIVLLLLVLVILAVAGFFGYSYFNASKTYNAGVYNYPTSAPTTPTPTEVVNPKDTTDSAIDSDNKVVDQELNNLNTDINGVDQSLNDKQTNLQ
jgi:hypothetical protein